MTKAALARWILNHRLVVSALLAAITLFFAWHAARVRFNNSIETYFLEDDIEQYRHFLDQFGTDEIIAVAFGGEEIFTADNLHLIDTISTKLEELPHVRRVLSLTTARIVYGEGENVYFEHLVDEIPASAEELAAVKQRALADPFLPGTVVSSDARHTAIVAEIDHIIGEFDYKIELISQIHTIVRQAELETGKTFRLGGTAVLDDALLRYTQRDQARYVPLMVVIIVGLVVAMFRSVRMAALPFAVVIVSMVWAYGFLALLGYQINIISTILTPLLMAVAVADSMHFVADYLQETATDTGSKRACIERSFVNVLTPCFMTSATTLLGLLALLAADLVPIREFGLVAAGGVFSAFVITMLLLPVLLSITPSPRKSYRIQFQKGPLAGLLLWLGRWHKGRAIAVIVVACALAAPAAVSLSRLTVGTNTLDYFKESDITRRATEEIDATIGGTASLEFLVETGEDDALKRPALLRRMEEFQEFLSGVDGVTSVYSAVDMVKTLNRGFHGGDERQFVIPSSSGEVAQQLFLVEGSDDAAELMSDDYSTGRIVARVQMDRSQALSHQMPEIQHQMREIFDDAATVTPTGMVHLMHQMEGYLLSSQIKSITLAFVVISVAMVVMLRSARLGLLAMIPNVLPVLFTLALMPLLGISLDVGTVMIAVIALGLVVDDSIHFLSRVKLELARVNDVRSAVAAALSTVGRPIVYTSIALSLGFLMLTLASFNTLIHFGLLSATVIVFALVFDLVVLPAIIGFVGMRPREGKHAVSGSSME